MRSPKQLANLKPPIKKGEVRNPNGVNNNKKAHATRLSKEWLEEIMQMLTNGDVDAIKDMLKNPKGIPPMKIWLASIVMRGISKGDYGPFDAILNRTIGKVQENIAISTDVALRSKYEDMTEEQLRLEILNAKSSL